jgi:hypothetical protein
MTRRTSLPLLPLLLAVAAASTGCSAGTTTQTNIVDMEGQGAAAATGKYNSTGPWDLKLTYDCTRQLGEKVPGATSGVSLTVYNADDQSEAFEHPESQWKGTRGNQVLHFKRSGPYSVAVDSKCDWHLVVVGTDPNS